MCDDFTGGKEYILVWRIKHSGQTMHCENIYDVASTIENDLTDMEEGATVNIKLVKMERKKFEALPDFEGF